MARLMGVLVLRRMGGLVNSLIALDVELKRRHNISIMCYRDCRWPLAGCVRVLRPGITRHGLMRRPAARLREHCMLVVLTIMRGMQRCHPMSFVWAGGRGALLDAQ
jgi:hypothetical protein